MTAEPTEAIEVASREVSVADLTPARLEHSTLVRPAGTVEEVLEAFSQYTALCGRILDDSDVQGIQGKSFRKRSTYRKLAAAFAVSYEVIERTVHRDPDTGKVQWAEFVVPATAPGGRFADGFGGCSLDERQFSKPNHDIPATAETRAKNRASADLFGMGEVSAEEVDRSDPSGRWADEGEFRAVIDAAKRLKADGGTPGAYPVVLGVSMIDADGNIAITAGQATELVENLERLRANLRAGAALNESATGEAPTREGGGGTQGAVSTSPAAQPAEAGAVDPEAPDATRGSSPASAPPETTAAPALAVVEETPPVPEEAPQASPAGEASAPYMLDDGAEINKATTNRIGKYASEAGLTPETSRSVASFCAGRPIASRKDLTHMEGTWVAEAHRLIRDQHLIVEPYEDHESGVMLYIHDPSGAAEDLGQTRGALWMQSFAIWRGLPFELVNTDDATTDQE